jgi:hypothetical protein
MINEKEFDRDFPWIEDEEEKKALRFYKSKNIEKLKTLVDNLSQEYTYKDFVHIKALYELLTNDEKFINTTFKALDYYEEFHVYDTEIIIYLVYGLKNFYQKKRDLEKIYTFILYETYRKFNHSTLVIVGFENDYSDYINEKTVPIILESADWIEKNIKLSKKEKKIINFTIYKTIDNLQLDKLNKKEKDKYFRKYIKAIWELKDDIDIKNIFAPLFKGIGWNYINLMSNKNEDIINYLINLGVEKSVAKDLFKLICLEEENFQCNLN